VAEAYRLAHDVRMALVARIIEHLGDGPVGNVLCPPLKKGDDAFTINVGSVCDRDDVNDPRQHHGTTTSSLKLGRRWPSQAPKTKWAASEKNTGRLPARRRIHGDFMRESHEDAACFTQSNKFGFFREPLP